MAEPILDAIFAARFENWRRWCLQKGLHRQRCGSAEGNWHSPQIWHPPGPRPEPINIPDAIAVNRAYTKLAMTAASHAKVIKIMVFRPYLKPQYQAQKLGIHYLLLEEALYRAKTMLKNILGGIAF